MCGLQARCEHSKPATSPVLRQTNQLASSAFETNIVCSPTHMDQVNFILLSKKKIECTSLSTNFQDLFSSSSNSYKIHLNNFIVLGYLLEYRVIRLVRDYSVL